MYEGQCFCGLPEHMEEAESLTGWAAKEVTYAFAGIMAAVESTQRQLTRRAWDLVEAACGVKLTEVDDTSKANIVIGAARGGRNNFDGAGGTLAWCEIPNGQRQVRLMFDLDEKWISSAGSGIEYMLVCLHEGMHGLGLYHAPKNSANVMAPVYNPRQVVLGSYDIAELRRRYGDPAPSAPSPIPGIPADQITIGDLQLMLVDRKTGKQYAFVPSAAGLYMPA